MNKVELRKAALEKRDHMDASVRKEASGRIHSFLKELDAYQMADTVLCYASFRSEVDTYEIISECIKMGKSVFCPKVLGPRHMEFYQIRSIDDLKPGKYGIPEPEQEKLQDLYCDQKLHSVCMIIPGAVFGKQGERIGYGGGFYDAYLEKHPFDCKIGLCFSNQVMERFETEATDQKMDILISEKEVFRFG